MCCDAGHASLEVLLQSCPELQSIQQLSRPDSGHLTIAAKAELFRSHLQHPAIKAIHGRGLLLAVEFGSAELCQRICHATVKAGLVTDWFLFAPNCLRIAPPLIITLAQVAQVA